MQSCFTDGYSNLNYTRRQRYTSTTKFDLIFKVKRKYENTNESTTWVSINERKRVSALYKEQEYNFIPKYSEIYEIGSETFVDDVTVAAEKMAQKIYDYYYM